jgi:hypothetical protein
MRSAQGKRGDRQAESEEKRGRQLLTIPEAQDNAGGSGYYRAIAMLLAHQVLGERHCGCPPPRLRRNGKIMVIPVGSLDTAMLIPPTVHIF